MTLITGGPDGSFPAANSTARADAVTVLGRPVDPVAERASRRPATRIAR
ncbi:hypothetical protein J2Z79_001241 [Symbiobacterium terraclitae]|uniref:Uncharacterized protein n=1 Tax=Symbiobacterium terraclitae TaxID=557451 RepID=A0ABS4JS81_9FIRM|nr:hypothetical protein [Symbiobacterium terraclitae]MBP2017856.1 hypothetical protein [Symbiobacterium terraclitae]